jgi:hypothetical protein
MRELFNKVRERTHALTHSRTHACMHSRMILYMLSLVVGGPARRCRCFRGTVHRETGAGGETSVMAHALIHTHYLLHSYTHYLLHSYTHYLLHSYTHYLLHSYTHALPITLISVALSRPSDVSHTLHYTHFTHTSHTRTHTSSHTHHHTHIITGAELVCSITVPQVGGRGGGDGEGGCHVEGGTV